MPQNKWLYEDFTSSVSGALFSSDSIWDCNWTEPSRQWCHCGHMQYKQKTWCYHIILSRCTINGKSSFCHLMVAGEALKMMAPFAARTLIYKTMVFIQTKNMHTINLMNNHTRHNLYVSISSLDPGFTFQSPNSQLSMLSREQFAAKDDGT